MKHKSLSALAGLGSALVLSGGAHAAYQGLTVRLHTQATVGQGAGAPALRDVYRVYAVFSDSEDFLTSVAGSPTLGNMTIQTRNQLGTGSGGEFINPFGGGITAPYYAYLGSQIEWDTFVTIGLASWGDVNGPPHQLEDKTGLSPGFPGLPNSGFLSTNNAGWFTPSSPQGRAINGVADVDGLGNWGVLTMQLTVNAGNHVSGTVAISGINADPLAGATTFQTTANQTFESAFIPTPGAMGLLMVAISVRSHRQRTV